MLTNNYQATVKLPGGGQQNISVQATSYNHARQLLEMQYGRGNVINLHQHA